MLNPFRRLGAWMYSKRVLPYTNTGTGMLFFGTGDLIVQSVVEGKRITERDQIDWKRVGKRFLFWEEF